MLHQVLLSCAAALGLALAACPPRPMPLYGAGDIDPCRTFATRVADDSAEVVLTDRESAGEPTWLKQNALCGATVKLQPEQTDTCNLALFPDAERALEGSRRLGDEQSPALVAHRTGRALFWCNLLGTRGAEEHPVVKAGKDFVAEYGTR